MEAEKDTYNLDVYPTVAAQLNAIVTGLKRRQLVGAFACAKATIEVLRIAIGTCKFHTTYQMMQSIRWIGRQLTVASPSELSIGNIVKRLLYLIREEYASKLSHKFESAMHKAKNQTKGPPASGTLSKSNHADDVDSFSQNVNNVTSGSDIANSSQISLGRVLSNIDISYDNESEFSLVFPDMRQGVLASIAEINEELDNLYAPICDQAQENIHADECILVYGHSLMTELFLKAAARKRRFQVIIAEQSIGLTGLKLATNLSKLSNNNIAVTLIPDSNIYAIMSRVNKVILSPHAVMMDGGCMAPSGNLMVALAAKEFAVPVVCLAGTYIMTPLFAHNQRTVLEQLLSPANIIPYDASVNFNHVDVIVPAFDLISPDLVDLYVTNNGSHQPSYIYRLLGELYHCNDYDK